MSVNGEMALPEGRGDVRVRSWGLARKRERTAKLILAGGAGDMPVWTGGIGMLPKRMRGRNGGPHRPRLTMYGDFMPASRWCQEPCGPTCPPCEP